MHFATFGSFAPGAALICLNGSQDCASCCQLSENCAFSVYEFICSDVSTKLSQNSKTSEQSDWELLNYFSVKVAMNSP